MFYGLENLSSREYPGRVIIIGLDTEGKKVAVCYAITGRSASSQARKLVQKQNAVWTVPTDAEQLSRGNTELLLYPSIIWLPQGIAVSNGKQTSDIAVWVERSLSPSEVLKSALENWDFEPDVPAFTPRISGTVLSNKCAALSVIRRAANNHSLRKHYEFPLVSGKGKMIMTYSGANRDPLPSFTDEPLDVSIERGSPKKMAESVFEALGPQALRKDFRVAVACLFVVDFATIGFELFIINRHEREEEK